MFNEVCIYEAKLTKLDFLTAKAALLIPLPTTAMPMAYGQDILMELVNL